MSQLRAGDTYSRGRMYALPVMRMVGLRLGGETMNITTEQRKELATILHQAMLKWEAVNIANQEVEMLSVAKVTFWLHMKDFIDCIYCLDAEKTDNAGLPEED